MGLQKERDRERIMSQKRERESHECMAVGTWVTVVELESQKLLSNWVYGFVCPYTTKFRIGILCFPFHSDKVRSTESNELK